MAISSIAVPADPKRDAAAAELAESAHTWSTGTLTKAWGAFPVGTGFFYVPSSDGGHYQTNAVFCRGCVDYRRGYICKHIRAVVLFTEQNRTPLKGYKELYPTCWTDGCTDDPEPGEEACWRHVNVSAF